MKTFIKSNGLLLLYIIIAFVLAMGIIKLLLSTTLSKYSNSETFKHEVYSKELFLKSNLVGEQNIETYIIASGNTIEQELNLTNGFAGVYFDTTLNYTIKCTIPNGSLASNCLVDNSSSPQTGTLNGTSTSVTNVHNIKFTIPFMVSGEYTVNIEMEITSPYKQTLTGTIHAISNGYTSTTVSTVVDSSSLKSISIYNNTNAIKYAGLSAPAGYVVANYKLSSGTIDNLNATSIYANIAANESLVVTLIKVT